LVYIFYTLDHQGIILNPVEIDDGRFWTWNEIERARGKEIFTPNLEFEIEKYCKPILSKLK